MLEYIKYRKDDGLHIFKNGRGVYFTLTQDEVIELPGIVAAHVLDEGMYKYEMTAKQMDSDYVKVPPDENERNS